MTPALLRLWLEDRGLLGLVEDVCRTHYVTFAELAGRGRETHVSRARQAAWSLLEMRGLSRSSIARAFGRDQTTVGAGIAASDKRTPSAGPAEAEEHP